MVPLCPIILICRAVMLAVPAALVHSETADVTKFVPAVTSILSLTANIGVAFC